jgi:hypothetical protein
MPMRRLRGGLGPARRLAAAALICGLVLAATPAVALAAGTPYTGGGTTGTTGDVGLPGSVVTTCNQTGAANTCTAQIGNCTVTITIPAGDLPSGSQLVITSVTDLAPPGNVLAVEFGVGAFNNGTKITTAFVEPLTATVSCPAFTAASKVFQVSSGGFTAVSSTIAGTSVTFSVPSDPVFQADNPGATTAASTTSGSGTTPAFTGANLIPEIVAGSILVLVGGVLLVGSRRLTRSRQASRAAH